MFVNHKGFIMFRITFATHKGSIMFRAFRILFVVFLFLLNHVFRFGIFLYSREAMQGFREPSIFRKFFNFVLYFFLISFPCLGQQRSLCYAGFIVSVCFLFFFFPYQYPGRNGNKVCGVTTGHYPKTLAR